MPNDRDINRMEKRRKSYLKDRPVKIVSRDDLSMPNEYSTQNLPRSTIKGIPGMIMIHLGLTREGLYDIHITSQGRQVWGATNRRNAPVFYGYNQVEMYKDLTAWQADELIRDVIQTGQKYVEYDTVYFTPMYGGHLQSAKALYEHYLVEGRVLVPLLKEALKAGVDQEYYQEDSRGNLRKMPAYSQSLTDWNDEPNFDKLDLSRRKLVKIPQKRTLPVKSMTTNRRILPTITEDVAEEFKKIGRLYRKELNKYLKEGFLQSNTKMRIVEYKLKALGGVSKSEKLVPVKDFDNYFKKLLSEKRTVSLELLEYQHEPSEYKP